MGIVNRGLVVVKPKQPFVDWLRRLPEPVTNVVLDQLRADCNAYLVPEWENPGEQARVLDHYATMIFEEELQAWHTVEEHWPRDRDSAALLEWFDVEPISVVMNLVPVLIEDEDM